MNRLFVIFAIFAVVSTAIADSSDALGGFQNQLPHPLQCVIQCFGGSAPPATVEPVATTASHHSPIRTTPAAPIESTISIDE